MTAWSSKAAHFQSRSRLPLSQCRVDHRRLVFSAGGAKLASMQAERSCDFLVIGAGSAGCVVAARLAEWSDAEVLLLEAGGSADRADVHDPRRWAQLMHGPLDWNYRTTPQSHLAGRMDHVPRARMLGGCHSHNAMIWVRGAPGDFDRWAAAGCVGWGWANVMPSFRRSERWHGPPHPWRGTEGPLQVTLPHDPHPLAIAFVEAAVSVGLPRLTDFNGAELQGAGMCNLTMHAGRRFSVVQGYLQPAISRPNFSLLDTAETIRLVLLGTRCVGAEVNYAGRQLHISARREVILCAGVIGSPRLLLLSGIGPAEDLWKLGIPVAVDLPGVGENLHDHPLVAVNYEFAGRMPPPRNNGVEAAVWQKSSPLQSVPDLHVVLAEFPYAPPSLAAQLPRAPTYCLAAVSTQPLSRGRVKLLSSDSAVPPAIDPNFLSDQHDIERMLAAVALAREIGAAGPLSPFCQRELLPGPLASASMREFVRQATTTYFHPVGTCRMGSDSMAVVDPCLRVRGMDGLRIADASVMPSIPSANTNAATVMIGERAAELILGD